MATTLDDGAGTVWAADATCGFHGAAAPTRWVTDDAEAAAVEGRARRRAAPRCGSCRSSTAWRRRSTASCSPTVSSRCGPSSSSRCARATASSTPGAPRSGTRQPVCVTRCAGRRGGSGEQLRADVDFRGAFTLDGVATRDGFRPTEVNPRFGAGLMVITTGPRRVPLTLVLDLVVAGRPLGVTAEWLEAELLDRGRRPSRRWHMAAARPDPEATRRPQVVLRRAAWRWAPTTRRPTASASAGGGFARLFIDARAHPGRAERRAASRRLLAVLRRGRPGAGLGPSRRRRTCSDRATGGRPVLVLEEALVELAGRVAGELGAEVDRARALDVGQLGAAEGDQLLGQRVARRRRRPASRPAGRRP